MADGQRIVVLGFENRFAAQDALTTVMRLQLEGKMLVRDATFVSVDHRWRARLEGTGSACSGRLALGDAGWGLLFGSILLVPVAGKAMHGCTSALMAKLVASGVRYRFVKELRESVQPGMTCLALLVSQGNRDTVLAELGRFHGIAELVDGSLPDEAVGLIQEALVAATATQGTEPVNAVP
jgi:uncharacterized membrane protein